MYKKVCEYLVLFNIHISQVFELKYELSSNNKAIPIILNQFEEFI